MSPYSLATSYSGGYLLENFNFVSFPDPTKGFVSYQNFTSAAAEGLVTVNPSTNAVTLSVDTTNIYPPDGSRGGRPSVRIESIAPVNQGLVIGDFAHMPGSVCGAWPSFWMYGPDWPAGGEIDIVEGANMAYANLMSAHTAAGCVLGAPGAGRASGTRAYTDCAGSVFGCNFRAPPADAASYGSAFNGAGGGVYALQWTRAAIRIWHFPRTAVPADVVARRPDPGAWGPPQAVFGGPGCDVDSHFGDMRIVLNIDFCGTYAGELWASDAQCSTYAKTCQDWVGYNPTMLTDLYWEINYIDMYSERSDPTTTSAIPELLPTTAAPHNGSFSHRPSRIAESASAAKTASSPVDSIVPKHNPATIGDFSYLGCFSSTTGFSTFNLSGTDPLLTLEKCVGLCSGKMYAGAVLSACYCADTLGRGTGAVRDLASCNQACPGNGAEYCGGEYLLQQRAALSSNVLLSMYANINGLHSTTPAPAPAPALGLNTTNSTTLPLSDAAFGAGANTTALQVITSTVTYTTVCSTNPAQLVTLTYCTTITVCPTSSPSIAQTTLTQSCAACGENGSSVVTLTIPVPVAVTSTASSTSTMTRYDAKKATATMTFFPVTAAAPPAGSTTGILMALLGLVGMFL